MGDTGVRRSILAELATLYGDLYTPSNVAISSTHQHSGVGGYLEDLLPQVTSLGYVPQTAEAIINGTVLAIQRAHNSLAPGSLSVGNATVLNANINRSPTAYLANPAEERAQYEYDQDKDMSVLRFDDPSGNARGLISFFPVHGTSLYEVCVFWVLKPSIAGFSGILAYTTFHSRIIRLSVVTTRAWQPTCTNVGAIESSLPAIPPTYFEFLKISVCGTECNARKHHIRCRVRPRFSFLFFLSIFSILNFDLQRMWETPHLIRTVLAE